MSELGVMTIDRLAVSDSVVLPPLVSTADNVVVINQGQAVISISPAEGDEFLGPPVYKLRPGERIEFAPKGWKFWKLVKKESL